MFSEFMFVVPVYCTCCPSLCHPMQCIVKVYLTSLMIMFLGLNCVNRPFSSHSPLSIWLLVCLQRLNMNLFQVVRLTPHISLVAMH